MALDLPPKLLLPQTPAIIRPAEARLLSPGFLPASKHERRAALAELIRTGKLTRKDAANALVVRWPNVLALLPGLVIAGVPELSPIVISYEATYTDITGLTTYTFSTADLGTAAADRKIVVPLVGRVASTTRTISSLTVAGIAATQAVFISVAAGTHAGIFVADVPTGATGDVVVTWSAGMARMAIATYAMYGASSSTPTATATDTTDPLSQSLAIQAGGAGFGTAMSIATVTGTWSGLTENVDAQVDSQYYGMASLASATATTPTVVCTPGTFAEAVMALAAFR